MRAERFGSYSIVETFAGISCLSRLKSMIRYIRLCPPPRHQEGHPPFVVRRADPRSGSTLHVALLPVRAPPHMAPLPLDVSVRDTRPDAGDLRAEQLLDRVLDLDLVGAWRHVEDDGPAGLAADRR